LSTLALYYHMIIHLLYKLGLRAQGHRTLLTSAFSFAVAKEQPEQVVFLAVFSFLFCCGCPDSQVPDVLDDCGEGLPVSLVEHVLVDGQ